MRTVVQTIFHLKRFVGLVTGRIRLLGSGAVLTAAVLSTTLPMPSPGAPMPNAEKFAGTPAVGALFNYGPKGIGGHFCTASVVNASHANLVITAAHCVSAHERTMVFIPGYRDGYDPHGVWQVSRVLVDKSWQKSQSPDDDFAFLVVKRVGSGNDDLEKLTGGEEIGVDQPDPHLVKAVGYPDGEQAPIDCENRVFDFTPTQLEFDCGGYTGGTSGGPLIAAVNPRTGTGTVVGVIGGYQYGGDTPQVSYAAKFRSNLASLTRSPSRRHHYLTAEPTAPGELRSRGVLVVASQRCRRAAVQVVTGRVGTTWVAAKAFEASPEVARASGTRAAAQRAMLGARTCRRRRERRAIVGGSASMRARICSHRSGAGSRRRSRSSARDRSGVLLELATSPA